MIADSSQLCRERNEVMEVIEIMEVVDRRQSYRGSEFDGPSTISDFDQIHGRYNFHNLRNFHLDDL